MVTQSQSWYNYSIFSFNPENGRSCADTMILTALTINKYKNEQLQCENSSGSVNNKNYWTPLMWNLPEGCPF